ncbi:MULTISPECIES: hypothetical protein [unclassified Methylobacterium]|uniref:hypothetical protein n=1 Tax=unclassified Methylobacterium TaxID=2615210 RepID=UPI00226A12D4|nr:MULTISPECIES: hypothetical protein [unclassified Methylobacterium]
MRQDPVKTKVVFDPGPCPSCYGSGAIQERIDGTTLKRPFKVTCTTCSQAYDGAVFHANGADAMSAQTEILKEHIRSSTKVKITQNIVAALFIILGIICVLYAPKEREIAANIVAAAVLLVGMGIAGVANLNLRLPLVKMSASGRPSPLAQKKR